MVYSSGWHSILNYKRSQQILFAETFLFYTIKLCLRMIVNKVVASIILLIVAAVNFFGITSTPKVIIEIFFINLVLLVLYVGISVSNVDVTNLSHVFGLGITGIVTDARLFFRCFDDFQRMAIMSNTIKNPQKSIPFSIIG
ncbi:hypothetical protein [Clostridium ljungdahlii]|uniref:hypothetical protein n=2 Tax=Clostridium ljungdahlii TaxID=1538 RepID=UPI00386B912F